MKSTIDPQAAVAAAQQTPDIRKTQRDRKSLKKSCQEFEAIFIQSMFKAMRKTVPESGLIKEDNASELYRDMLDQEVASKISRQQSLGLADQMYRQMEKKLPPEK
jgi:peptidoglycan hydrolase FlgJ